MSKKRAADDDSILIVSSPRRRRVLRSDKILEPGQSHSVQKTVAERKSAEADKPLELTVEGLVSPIPGFHDESTPLHSTISSHRTYGSGRRNIFVYPEGGGTLQFVQQRLYGARVLMGECSEAWRLRQQCERRYRARNKARAAEAVHRGTHRLPNKQDESVVESPRERHLKATRWKMRVVLPKSPRRAPPPPKLCSPKSEFHQQPKELDPYARSYRSKYPGGRKAYTYPEEGGTLPHVHQRLYGNRVLLGETVQDVKRRLKRETKYRALNAEREFKHRANVEEYNRREQQSNQNDSSDT